MNRVLVGLLAFLATIGLAGAGQAQRPTAWLSVEWEGIASVFSGSAIYDQAQGKGTLQTQAVQGIGACKGDIAAAEDRRTAAWTLACDSGRRASGVFDLASGTAGIGRDGDGRQVKLYGTLVKPAAAPARPTTAAAPAPRETYASAAELKQKVYEHLLQLQAGAKVSENSSGPAASYAGRTYDYRGLRGGKAMAACINWTASSVATLQAPGFAFIDAQHYGPRMGELREQALQRCGSFVTKGCQCQMIDENDRNVVDLPQEFVQRLVKK